MNTRTVARVCRLQHPVIEKFEKQDVQNGQVATASSMDENMGGVAYVGGGTMVGNRYIHPTRGASIHVGRHYQTIPKGLAPCLQLQTSTEHWPEENFFKTQIHAHRGRQGAGVGGKGVVCQRHVRKKGARLGRIRAT